MPERPLRQCAQQGCRNLVGAGRCREHARQREQRRGSSTQRGLGVRQRAWREVILARDPMCRGCERHPSRQADHIVPRKPGAEDWTEENGQGLCDSCHSYKTAVEQRDPFFGLRLRDEGRKLGEPAPRGWRALTLFGGDA